MNVYVACSSREIPRARAVMATLVAAGHVNVHDWTPHVERAIANGTAEHMLDDGFALMCAKVDLDGVDRADALVFLAPTDAAKGAWVELGYAIGRGFRRIVVAHDEVEKRNQSIFTRVKSWRCADDEIVETLARLAQ